MYLSKIINIIIIAKRQICTIQGRDRVRSHLCFLWCTKFEYTYNYYNIIFKFKYCIIKIV